MENGLRELLESEVLSEETKAALAEAWEKKAEELRESLREEVKDEVLSEYKARFEEDKTNLTLAMNDMLGEAVQKYAAETGEELKRLKEERKNLTKAIKEARDEYKARGDKEAKVIESFVMSQLKDKVESLAEEKAQLEAQRVAFAKKSTEAKELYKAKVIEHMTALQDAVSAKLKEELAALRVKEAALDESKVESLKKLREHRIELNKLTAKRINELDKFVVEQLSKEIEEFQQDKDSLVEMRVKLASEAKAKLAETQKEFIERASKVVESTVNSRLKKEMTRLKEDIRVARENTFARRIYEAFQTEFMTSYLSEGTQVKKLTTQLDEMSARLAGANKLIAEQQEIAKTAISKAKMSEERALRAKTLSDLLRPLSNDKREVMEDLLERTKTTHLKEAFRKFLPAVLNETVNGNKTTSRQKLSEAKTVNTSKTVTGNKHNRLAETARAEDNQAQKTEILELRRLAGIGK